MSSEANVMADKGIVKGQAKVVAAKRKKSLGSILWAQKVLILMSIPLLIHRIIFSYLPLYGWTMAFQNFRPAIRSIWDQTWVGFDHFEMLLIGPLSERFFRSVINTLGQSSLMLLTGTIGAIILSLLLNEMKQIGAKRIIQNILYLPHFLGMIIIAGLASRMLSLDGAVNQFIGLFGVDPVLFLGRAEYFWGIMAGINLWRTLGWSSIIYLAAMTGIDPSLYEAAEVDGANRYQKMWYITLPGIKSTIIILLIMNLGWILNAGFELQWILGNGLINSRAEILDVFILRFGIEQNNFSLATAAGILRTAVSIFMVVTANLLAKAMGQERLI